MLHWSSQMNPPATLIAKVADEVGKLFQEILTGEQRAVGMVTHEPAVAAWADRVVILVDGNIVDDFSAKGDAATIAQRSHVGVAGGAP